MRKKKGGFGRWFFVLIMVVGLLDGVEGLPAGTGMFVFWAIVIIWIVKPFGKEGKRKKRFEELASQAQQSNVQMQERVEELQAEKEQQVQNTYTQHSQEQIAFNQVATSHNLDGEKETIMEQIQDMSSQGQRVSKEKITQDYIDTSHPNAFSLDGK